VTVVRAAEPDGSSPRVAASDFIAPESAVMVTFPGKVSSCPSTRSKQIVGRVVRVSMGRAPSVGSS